MDLPVYKTFIKKYTEHELPSSNTFRYKYLDRVFDHSISEVQRLLQGHKIYVSIDGTTDIAKRSVAAFIVGSLSEINVGPFLFNLKTMEKSDTDAYYQFLIESLELLYEGTGK